MSDSKSSVIHTYYGRISVNPLPDDKILYWSKLKQMAEDILKFV